MFKNGAMYFDHGSNELFLIEFIDFNRDVIIAMDGPNGKYELILDFDVAVGVFSNKQVEYIGEL